MVGENARGDMSEDHLYCLLGEISSLVGMPILKSELGNKWTVCMDGPFLLERKSYVQSSSF